MKLKIRPLRTLYLVLVLLFAGFTCGGLGVMIVGLSVIDIELKD